MRAELERLAALVSTVVPGCFVGDGESAAERRVNDNIRSGAMTYRAAGKRAKFGLEKLNSGDDRMAEILMRAAQRLEADAYRRQTKEADFATLSTGAAPIGRKPGRHPATAERDRRLLAAVEAQEARGITGAAAIAAAFSADPDLAREFRESTDSAIAKALARAR